MSKRQISEEDYDIRAFSERYSSDKGSAYEDEVDEETQRLDERAIMAQRSIQIDKLYAAFEEDDLEMKTREFDALLDGLSTVDHQRKYLMKSTFKNACKDRALAHALFQDAFSKMDEELATHAAVGVVLVKYLERAQIANAQISKLIEIIKEIKKDDDEAKISSAWD